MSSFSFAGHDFSRYLTAELAEPAAQTVEPDAREVPGRPGALLAGGRLRPLVLTLRVFLDAGEARGDGRSRARALLRSWLAEPSGGTLSVPGERRLEWHDAVLTGCSGWSALFSGGSAELEFTAHDPIAWGERRSTADAGAGFVVGGTWETRPAVELSPEAGVTVVSVSTWDMSSIVWVDAPGGSAFEGGETVTLDFASESCRLDGDPADELVEPGSEFFALAPGRRSLYVSGCSSHLVTWRERWA